MGIKKKTLTCGDLRRACSSVSQEAEDTYNYIIYKQYLPRVMGVNLNTRSADANRQLSLRQRRSVSMATWRSKGSALIQWTTINRYWRRHTSAGWYCLSCHYLARWKSLSLRLLGLTFSTHPSLTQWPLSVTPALVIVSRALALLRRIGLWIRHRGASAITKI